MTLSHPFWGDMLQKNMFIRKKKYPSGNVGVIVVEKVNGKMNELTTIGIAHSQKEIATLLLKGRKRIDAEQERRHPRLDLFGEERKKCDAELLSAEQMLSCNRNMLMKRHQRIAPLFTDEFWGTR